jgi:Mg/Co/Ni transporter MgtE
MADKQTTGKTFPRLEARDFAMGILWILVISGVAIVGSNMLSHARAPTWEVGLVYLTSTVALATMAIAAMVLTPFYVLTHIRKKSEHRNGK